MTASVSIPPVGTVIALGSLLVVVMGIYLDHRYPRPKVGMELSDWSGRWLPGRGNPPRPFSDVMLKLENRGAGKADVKVTPQMAGLDPLVTWECECEPSDSLTIHPRSYAEPINITTTLRAVRFDPTTRDEIQQLHPVLVITISYRRDGIARQLFRPEGHGRE